MSEFFKSIPKIAYEGKHSKNPLAFKFYNPEEVIAGKTMREQLKFALSWWHTMGGDGTDMFGCGTTDKTWGCADASERAKAKVYAAFEIMEKLSIDYYCFHDRDLSPEYGRKSRTLPARSCCGAPQSALITPASCTAQAPLPAQMFSHLQQHRSRMPLTLLSSWAVRATFSGAEEKDMRLF